ncbi:MAG: hypothetical protein L3J82_00480 [Planctomycetes bacterium]|nr:hypothetical protein [Planctomycetota bacterium]
MTDKSNSDPASGATPKGPSPISPALKTALVAAYEAKADELYPRVVAARALATHSTVKGNELETAAKEFLRQAISNPVEVVDGQVVD